MTTRRRHSTERARVVIGRAGPRRGRFDHARETVRAADAAADAFFRPNVRPEACRAPREFTGCATVRDRRVPIIGSNTNVVEPWTKQS